MAHFFGTIQGSRGEATRLGHAKTGLQTRANGWSGGVRVNLYVNDAGQDCARVTLTSGSGNAGPHVDIFDGPIDEAGRTACVGKKLIKAVHEWPAPSLGAVPQDCTRRGQ